MQFKFLFKIVILILSIFFCFSNVLVAQETISQYYITKDGVKTPIVFEPFTLKSEKSRFLYDNVKENDQAPRYEKLKDAMGDTEHIRELIDTIQNRSTDSEGTFSLVKAKKNIDLLNKEKNIKNANGAASLEELVFLKGKYGDRPSYYINEIEVDQAIFNKVSDREILNRQINVQNTMSGNPNGEMRIVVSEKTIQRLQLNDGFVDESTDKVSSYAFTQPMTDTKMSKNKEEIDAYDTATDNKNLDTLLKQIMQLDTNNKDNKSLDTPSRVMNAQKNTTEPSRVKNEKTIPRAAPQREIVYSYDEINNRNPPKAPTVKNTEEEVFVVRTSDWKKMENVVPENDTEPKSEKRSVRDIKNRERDK